MDKKKWKRIFVGNNAFRILIAFSQLEKSVLQFETREFSDLEKQGLIQSFEFTHELAWNVLKDYF